MIKYKKQMGFYMLKLLIIFILISLNSISFIAKADEIDLINKGTQSISDNFITYKSKKVLSNGNTSLLYKFGKNNSCRVEFNKKNNIVKSECNVDSLKRKEDRLKKQYERIAEDQVAEGYCSLKIKSIDATETTKNRCNYYEYILFSKCSEKGNCLDYREWYIQSNHKK